MKMPAELCIVIPVYNEEENIVSLIQDWHKVFLKLNIQHQFFVVEDGSTDKSYPFLEVLRKEIPNIEIIQQSNQGHGPSILKGYHLALFGQWVFQIDSDHQLDTNSFELLWKERNSYDLLIGERKEKGSSGARNVISLVSSTAVRLLYGNRLQDVNSPYRLIRTSLLAQALEAIPMNCFVPNILMSAYFISRKSRIFTIKVDIRAGIAPRRSHMNLYFLKGSIRGMIEVILFRFKT
jgi:dolichol-phosphate mannosyltransferase